MPDGEGRKFEISPSTQMSPNSRSSFSRTIRLSSATRYTWRSGAKFRRNCSTDMVRVSHQSRALSFHGLFTPAQGSAAGEFGQSVAGGIRNASAPAEYPEQQRQQKAE